MAVQEEKPERSGVHVWPVRDTSTRLGLWDPGFEISAKFRRNFSFPLGTGKKYFGIFGKFRFENPKFKKNRLKFTEIHRNSPEFRNGIPFPPITGISPENEMVNPGWPKSVRLVAVPFFFPPR